MATKIGPLVLPMQVPEIEAKTLAPVITLSPDLEEELSKAASTTYFWFEVDFPDRTRSYTMRSIPYGPRFFEGKILSASSIRRSIVDRRNTFVNFQYSVEIIDTDFDLGRLLAGPYAPLVRGSACRCGLFSTDVPGRYTYLEGRILSPKMTTNLAYSIPVVANSLPLEDVVPRSFINKHDFPNSDPAVDAKVIPLIYGIHDSTGITNKGMIPAYRVDSINFRYLLSLGILNAVLNVYSNDVLMTEGSDYTIIFPVIGGKQLTMIQFTADQEDKRVAADVEGYESVGDGTGVVIDNFPDQLKHLMVNFGWGNYQMGQWLPDTSAPIQVTYFQETKNFLAALGFQSSRAIIDSQRVLMGIINEGLSNFPIKGFWAKPGKFAIRPNEFRRTQIYIDDFIVRWDQHQMEPGIPPFDNDDLNVLDRVDISFLYDSNSGKFQQTLVVEDPSVREGISDKLDYYWSSARMTAAVGGGSAAASIILVPFEEGDYTDWVVKGKNGSDKVLSVTPDPEDVSVHDGMLSYLRADAIGDKQSFRMTGAFSGLKGVTEIKIGLQWSNADSSTTHTLYFYARVNGVDGAKSEVSLASGGSQSRDFVQILSPALARPGGGVWTVADITNPTFQLVIEWKTNVVLTGSNRVTLFWGHINGTTSPILVENPRLVASLLLRDSRPKFRVSQAVDMAFIKHELMDDGHLSHFVLPHADGPGDRVLPWERLYMRLVEEEFVPHPLALRQTYESKKHLLILDWDVGLSTQAPTTNADGIARISIGTRTFERDSNAWIESPGSGQVVLIGPNTEPNSKQGLQLEGRSEPLLKNSAFTLGIASNWTTQGTGSNGSSVANEMAFALLFDTQITPNVIKITAGDPLGATPCGLRQQSISVAADEYVAISLTHFDFTGAPISIRLQRSVDSYYWNQVTRTWQVAEVWFVLPVRRAITRDFLKKVPVGANATMVTATAVSHSVDGQINYVEYFQIEKKRYPTGYIVTLDELTAREAGLLTISNNDGSRTWPTERLSYKTELIPEWDTADLHWSEIKTLIFVFYDANNEDKFSYRAQDSSFIFRRKRAGTVYEAKATAVCTRGIPIKVGCRATSAEGEQNLATFTISAFAGGSKGVDAVVGAEQTATPESNMIRGSEGLDLNGIDGWVRYHEVTQQVLTDSEMVS
jgi:hypothetical protein